MQPLLINPYRLSQHLPRNNNFYCHLEKSFLGGLFFRTMKLISQHLCKLHNIGLHGNLFGGQLLSWIDEAGFILAAEYAQSYDLVTARIDRTDFSQPALQGDVISIYGEVVKQGRSSVNVRIEVHKNLPQTLTPHTLVAQTFLIFVRIDPITKKSLPIQVNATQS